MRRAFDFADFSTWRCSPRIAWGGTAIVLFGFALWQLSAPNGDLSQYRCFALAFWRGDIATSLPGCVGRLPVGPFAPLRVLPREYPPLALVPFSLPLLFGGGLAFPLYVLLFNLEMLLCLGVIWSLVRQVRGDGAAQLFSLWTLLGATTIALVRYDAVPALVTVAAIVLALRGPSWRPYLLLAVGALLKLYPALLIPLLAAWDWQRRTPNVPWQRYVLGGPALAALFGGFVQLFADVIARQPGIPWLSVQGDRPPQIESTAGGISWLAQVLRGNGGSVHAVSVQRSLALIDPVGRPVAAATLALSLLLLTVALAQIATGRLAPLPGLAGGLVAILAGASIFSPQYILWATPLVALASLDLAGARKRRLIVVWTCAAICTTIIYSVGYLAGWPAQTGFSLGVFMLFVIARDALVWWAALLCLGIPDSIRDFRSLKLHSRLIQFMQR